LIPRLDEAFREFLDTDLDGYFERTAHLGTSGGRLQQFHEAAASVPAYAQFLEEHGIEPADVASLSDFQKIPPVTRDNYLRKYPLSDLCRNGDLAACDMIAVSSGSTGKPGFWPRTAQDELGVARRFEQIVRDGFEIEPRGKSVLAVVCFALGTWVGGMYTAACCRHLAARGYRITVITPGSNRDEIFRTVQDLAPGFDTTVLLGYPPFLKNVIDAGAAQGINWAPYNIRLVLAGEVFSEEWRSLMAERTGLAAEDINHFAASMYGTADAGVLGVETPISVAIRRFLAQRPEVARALFGESRLPTLVQYDPASRSFEKQDGRMLFTGRNGIPLVRYDILDNGGLFGYEELLSAVQKQGFELPAACKQSTIRHLPFVYVFGRSNFTVSYFGANIFPENITVGLEQPGIREWTTGKFVLETAEDADRMLQLRVTVELAPGEAPTQERAQLAAASIKTHLERLNSEFLNYAPAEYRMPKVELRAMGDAEYFPVGIKHRYTRASAPQGS